MFVDYTRKERWAGKENTSNKREGVGGWRDHINVTINPSEHLAPCAAPPAALRCGVRGCLCRFWLLFLRFLWQDVEGTTVVLVDMYLFFVPNV